MLRVGQVIQGRWRVVSPLPASGEWLRWFGRESDSGRMVEILRPKQLVPLRRRRALIAGFRAAQGDPAVARVLHVGDEGVVVRRLPPERTLETFGAISPAAAVELAGWLGPAVIALAPVLAGRLPPGEVALDHLGQPTLAPGRSRERLIGADPQGSALQALGRLLYQLLSGVDPGPEPRPLREVAPAVPVPIEEMVMGLMSSDPVRARNSLPLRPDAAPRLDRHPDQPAAALPDAPADQPWLQSASRPPFSVVIDPASPGSVGRRRLAEAMGLSEKVFDDFIARELPLPVASAQSAEEANIWMEEISNLRVRAWVVARDPRVEAAWMVQASPLLAGAGLAAAIGALPLAAAALAGASGVVGWKMSRSREDREQLQRAFELLENYEDPGDGEIEDMLASQASRSHDLSSAASPGAGRDGVRAALRAALKPRKERERPTP
jgi:hypothetical protein